jgi:rhodanese-related sulfurtransferase
MIVAPRIDPATARAKFDAGEAVPLDVTSSLVYPAVTHRIPGAIRIAPEPIIRAMESARPAAEVLNHFGGLPDDREIVAYCT